MVFRFLKNLAAVVKLKTYRSNHGYDEFTWKKTKTDRIDVKRILVFGDSNAYRPGRSKKCWPKLLEAKDPLHLDVLNESCDGRTTRYDTGEYNGLSVIGEKLIAHKPLDYVFVALGTNDVKNKYGPPTPTEIAEGMSRIFEVIENHGGGAKPILLTPPPLGNVNSGELAGAQPRIPFVAVEYRRLSRNLNFQMIDIHSILDINTDFEPDFIHLNAIGRKKMAKTLWAYLQGVNSYYRNNGPALENA